MAKFSLMQKTINLEQIEGKYSAFAKCPYAMPVRLSRPLAEDGYGTVTVDGIELSKGKVFFMDSVIKMNCMLVPVGEAAREFDREYTITFSDFRADNGERFRNQSFKFRTLPRKQRDAAYAEHDAVALQAAREGMVLLKNEGGLLPLKEDAMLNCFGAAQYMYRNSATGAGLINPRWQADFHQSVNEHSSFSVNPEISRLYSRLKDVIPSESQMKNAYACSDTAVIFISRTSGEFLDNKPIKGNYYLTDDERKLIETVSKTFDKTIAVLNTGYPIETGWIDEYNIRSVIYTGFAGMCSGYALAEILDGRTNPSGKLPTTWAYDYYDYPSSHNFPNFSETDIVPGEKEKGVRIIYEEDIYVGYRYFDTFRKPVRFPFGFGLSYTGFKADTESVQAGINGIDLSVSVTNTGSFNGKEAVLLYVQAPSGRLEKPAKVLCAFEKTAELKPGETGVLTMHADAMSFASYDEEKAAYILEPGIYVLHLGGQVSDTVQIGTFTIDEETVVRQASHIAAPVESFHRFSQTDPVFKEQCEITELSQAIPAPAKRKEFRPDVSSRKHDRRISADLVARNPQLMPDFTGQLSVQELCRLNVSTGADWYMPWGKGTAGGTPAMKQYGLPAIRVSDGNTGLNIVKPNIGFPSSCTIAATFNKTLAQKVGHVIGEESSENDIAVNLGPAMNIQRNILCGRHPEYFSEDPLLAGTMAGYHSRGLEETGTGSTIKHLFCNNSETSRKGSHSIVSERALREIYFRPFEISYTIQKPQCIMTSYNALNGIYPAESAEILQDLIRGEWGFDGLIMTDWCSYDTIDPVEMVKAGTGWLTEGGSKYVRILKKAVKDGRLSPDILRDNAAYTVRLIGKHKQN